MEAEKNLVLSFSFSKGESLSDPVNHPDYYTDGKIEVADFICDKDLNFCLGNVVKYVSRAGKKDPETHIQDLKKAAWYLNREIERLSPMIYLSERNQHGDL